MGRVKIGARWSSLPGRSWFDGLAHGGPRPRLTFLNALTRWLFLEVDLLEQLWLPMLQIERLNWKLICLYEIIEFVNPLMRITAIVSISQSTSYQKT
nr:glycerol-3-phosphate dehydrogenase [NAD(+)] 2, chloroplastic isoform X2 [Ipomoea batatas]